jgi:hypothetical protein
MKSLIFPLFAIASSVLAGDASDGTNHNQAGIAGPKRFSLYSLDTNGITKNSIKQDQTRIAGLIETWPVSKTQFFLYSLDPSGGTNYDVNTERVFHGFTILGKAEIKTEDDPTALLRTFAQGIRENDGQVAFCFNPRHGLRLIAGSSTNDFVICFECGAVNTYGFNDGKGFYITASPSAAFNHLVDKYHLKKPKKND